MSTTDDRAAALRAELAAIEQAEQEQAAREREAAALARREQMPPELASEAQSWEEKADQALEREFPAAWQPQKNNEHPRRIVGKVLRINPSVGPSDYGTYSAAVEVVTTAQDEWTIWASHTGTMYQTMLRLQLQPGEMVAIEYRGKKESQRNPGQSYQDFRLVVLDRADETGDWVDYEQLRMQTEQPQLPPPPGAGGPATPDDDGIPF